MKNIMLILRREFGAYARTPSGYIIGAAYLLVNGILFNTRALGEEARYSEEVLQYYLIDSGFTTVVAAVLLSMRLLAEERQLGTDVLLFTSPIREGEIVLGKYFAALAFLVVMVVASAYLPALIFVNGKVSVGHIVAGYLGMIFLGGATLAVGVFASTLVKNQFLAVLLTALFAVIFDLLWWIAQSTDPPLNSLLSYLPPYMKHYHPFRRGLLQLSDVVFYLSMIYLFLYSSVRVLQSQRWR